MTARPFSLADVLERAAAHHGDRVAVVGDGRSLSYDALNEAAGRFAGHLRSRDVARGDRVAVWAEKSIDTVVALYGIMRAGAAYVPIDPKSPPRRAERIVGDAACAAACLDAARAVRLEDPARLAPVLVGLGDDPVAGGADSIADVDDAAPPLDVCESDLAYLLYTSGSTGAPKGVMLTHRNALAFVEWAVERFQIGPDDVLSSHAPFHFDLSVLDLYGAAHAGAAVHLVDAASASLGAEMAAFVEGHGITVWYSVPSALVLLSAAADTGQVAGLRVVLFAGEPYPIKHLRRLRELVPDAVLANLYGPTETNVCTYHVLAESLAGVEREIPIGRACENQEVFALDDEQRPVAVGEIGELWVRGPTVMKGYWGDREKTDAALGQNPLHDDFPDPCYRTGDLVRTTESGDLDFLGRRDHQVKSRGYRIDLGEVESALVSHEAVREVAVVAVPDEKLGNALVAVLAVDGEIDTLDLKRHCAERIPRYMIPGEILVHDALPHTSTGKIDRQRLRAVAEQAVGVPS